MSNTKTASFIAVGNVDDFPPGRGKRVQVEGAAVALFRVGDAFYALRDRCTHAAAPLSSGTVKGMAVACPRHGAQFDLRTGAVLSLQAVRNVETYEVVVVDGEVMVCTRGRTAAPLWVHGRRLDQGAPGPQEAFPEDEDDLPSDEAFDPLGEEGGSSCLHPTEP